MLFLQITTNRKKNEIMDLNSQKISVFEKVGYSLGDLAANLVFQTLITYLAYFYTDIYGLKSTRDQLHLRIRFIYQIRINDIICYGIFY